MNQIVSRRVFRDVLDRWVDDVRMTALRLYDRGTPAHLCVPEAAKIVELHDTQQALRVAAANAERVAQKTPEAN